MSGQPAESQATQPLRKSRSPPRGINHQIGPQRLWRLTNTANVPHSLQLRDAYALMHCDTVKGAHLSRSRYSSSGRVAETIS